MVRPRRSPDRARFRDGFSLLELMTAVVILVLVIYLLHSVLGSMQSGLSNLNASVLQRQDGRMILSNMARELRESLLPVHRTFEGLDPSNRQLQLLMNPSTLPGELANGHTLFWSAQASDPRGGSRLIGYAVRWGLSEEGRPRPRLCRLLVSFPESLPILHEMQQPAEEPPDDHPLWVTEELLDTYAPGEETSGYRGWLADYVLALFVRPLDPENKPITHAPRVLEGMAATNYNVAVTRTVFATSVIGPEYLGAYDSRLGYQYLRSDLPANDPNARVNAFGPMLPPAIEIVLVVADPRSLRSLEAKPEYPPIGSSANLWTDVETFISGLPEPVRKETRVFSTIVPLSPSL